MSSIPAQLGAELAGQTAILVATLLLYFAALALADARQDPAGPVSDWLAGAGVVIITVVAGVFIQRLLAAGLLVGGIVGDPDFVSILGFVGLALLVFWWLRAPGGPSDTVDSSPTDRSESESEDTSADDDSAVTEP